MQSYVDQISVTKDAVSKRNKAPDGDWSEWTDIYSSKYTKPSGGIPKTDLATAVQASLDNADSAVQNKASGGNVAIGVGSSNDRFLVRHRP